MASRLAERLQPGFGACNHWAVSINGSYNGELSTLFPNKIDAEKLARDTRNIFRHIGESNVSFASNLEPEVKTKFLKEGDLYDWPREVSPGHIEPEPRLHVHAKKK